MTKTRCVTCGKFEENSINEDAVIARKNMIAVSDGAGGGGLFADRWSKYLLWNLPASAITSAEMLDEWIGSIWEAFYNRAEKSAERLGGMALDKFYDEGSFATLAAAWVSLDGICQWMSCGDSVVFHYDYATKKLTNSFTSLADFNRAPYLVNCKDELNPDGFRCGSFRFGRNSFIFAASDALSHYVMMMYELSRHDEYIAEIGTAVEACSKNGNILRKGMSIDTINFEKLVIDKLRKAAYNPTYFRKWLKNLLRRGLIASDDYSLSVMYM